MAPQLPDSGRFDRSEEHTMLRQTVREFARGTLAPRAEALDERGEFPMENFRDMAGLGLTGIPIPEDLGGAGADFTAYILTVEEISKQCASTALTLCAHTSLGTLPIVRWGSDDLKRKYVPFAARGERIASYGLTEPGAGSDSGATATTANRKNGSWVLNGSKMFVTNASVASTFVMTAVTDRDKAKHERISAFVLEAGWPGLTVAKKENKLGVRASDTCYVTLEDVEVPGKNLLGVRGEGFKYFMQTLDSGRIAIGAMALGIAQGALERAVEYAGTRKAFGKPIADLQAVQFMISDSVVDVEAAQHLVYHAAKLRDEGKPFGREAAVAKLFASEAAMRVCHRAIQVHGGYGYMTEYGVERHMRDAKLCEIGEGTSEIQRIVIARHVLGRT